MIRKDGKERMDTLGLAAPVNPSTHGSRPELWRTPSVAEEKNQNTSTQIYLQNQVGATPKAWATPRTKDAEGWMMNQARLAAGKPEDTLTGQALNSNKNNGKLNPRWVETLMGVPIGWTMPSCSHPIASPANVAMTLSAGNAEDTMQTAHVLGPIVLMTDNRTDELRLLGNGVVPATAEKAFRTLWNQLK
jgi:hypothetical protein